MENKGNLILAIILSTIIIGGWNYFFPAAKNVPLPDKPAVTQSAQPTNADKKTLTIKPRDQALADSPRLMIDSPKLKGSINLRGLRFDDLTLVQYSDAPNSSVPVTLLSPSNSTNGYVVDLGWLSHDDGLQLPNSDSLWSANKKILKPGEDVTLSYNADGLAYKVFVSLDNDYLFTIKQSVQNLTPSNLDISFYGLVAKFGPPPPSTGLVHEGALAILDKKLTEKNYNKMVDQPFQGEGKTGWLGFSDKYWLTALVPNVADATKPANSDANQQPSEATATDAAAVEKIEPKFVTRISYDKDASGGRGRYQVDYASDFEILQRRRTIEKTIYLFAGAKETGLINDYTSQKHIEKFDLTIDYGMLYIITMPMAWLLHFLSTQLNSVGLAIISLTVIVRLLLFPFAQHSFRSMAMMRNLAPKVAELKKRYKSQQEQSQAMMAMYKKEGVNPLAGCLPMLIQIPVFFALYRVFIISIEFRHAPFFGWISDLSSPDPLGILTLFGLIPWHVPGWLHIFNIGIWPIIMGFTLWLQQKFNPPAADPIQAKIFSYFPYVFTFMLGSSPAGLVIYWSWNNILSILQQYVINRQLGDKNHVPFRLFKK